MSDQDNNSTPQKTAIDTRVDQSIPITSAPLEQYTKSDDGDQISKTHSIDSTTTTPPRSFALSEIERTISNRIVPNPKKRIAQFGLDVSRKNDFGLPGLANKLSDRISIDSNKEIKTGPVVSRVRKFDVQSQALRQISANAALGSYQFQRTQALPFMRKSLALSYQKVHLLKQSVGAIGRLEKALVAKLEAIKMNTAAIVPKKDSLLTKLKDAIQNKHIDRVATNVSNFVMNEYEEKYRKHISPLMQQLNRDMTKEGPRGGVNAVGRTLTSKLNRLRRSMNTVASQSTEGLGTLGRLRVAGAGLAGGALGGVVRIGQKAKLGAGANSFVTNRLMGLSNKLSKINPFAIPNVRTGIPDEHTGLEGDHQLPTGLSPFSSKLDGLITTWKAETKQYQKKSLEHLTAIRLKVAPFKTLQLKRNPIRTRMGVSGLPLTNPNAPSAPWSNTTPLPVKSAANQLLQSKKPTAEQSFFRSITATISKKLDVLNTSVKFGDKNRTKFEQSQVKHQKLVDKLAAGSKIRKNSYEDLMAQRQAKSATGIPLTKKLSTLGLGTFGLAGSKDSDEDESGFGLGDAVDFIKDKFGDKDEDSSSSESSADGKPKKKTRSRTQRKAARARLRRMRGRTGRGGKFSLLRKGLGKVGKLGKGGMLKGGLSLGKGALSLAKGPLGVALASGVAQSYFDKYATGESKQAGDTLFSAATYGGIGAQVGAMFGGVGAVPGALIGAGLGAVIANSDKAASALGQVADATGSVIGGLWTSVFGQRAIVKTDGTVLRKEKTSIIGDVRALLFGKSARYSKSGELISPGRGNFISNVQYGFQKFFLGDTFSNGQYKEGTSVLEMARDGVTTAILSFRDQLSGLPTNLVEGFKKSQVTKAATWSAGKLSDGAKEIVSSARDAKSKANLGFMQALLGAGKFTKDTANRIAAGDYNVNIDTKTAASFTSKAAYFMAPSGFITGFSNAIMGWSIDSGYIDSPTSSYYPFVTEVLGAYGIRNRSLYKLVHSFEVSQDKINKGEAKNFDDKDMEYMASRFGFDPKNKEAVNYFKMWYKRRFMPGMAIIGRVLKSHRLTFDSVLSADEKQIASVIDHLKKEVASSDLKATGLEPSVQAYNKYAKKGAEDPGGVTGSAAVKTKPFDPRDPSNRTNSGAGSGFSFANNIARAFSGNSPSGSNNSSGDSGNYNQPASRKNAAMVKGNVKDQPEFRAAFQKLPPKIRAMVAKSKPLQFVLWSSAVQHGPDMASQIFQHEYSDQVDEGSYLRKIYQDRSTKFGNLSGSDRAEAMSHLGQEQNYAMGIANGTSDLSRGTMGSMVNNVIDPTSGGFGGNFTPTQLKGSVASRARDAYNYFVDKKGYSKIASLAIVGNLIEESQMNPNANGDSGRAGGLAQWNYNGGRRGRVEKLVGGDIRGAGFYKQLDVIDWELRTGHGVTGGKSLLNDMNSTGNVASAVSMFVDRYERPAERRMNKIKRTQHATAVMKSLGTDTGKTNQVAGGSPSPASNPTKPNAPAGKSPPANNAKPTQRPAPRKAAPAPAQHDMAAWMPGLSKSLDNHALALAKYGSAPPAQGPTQVNMSPFIQHNSGRPGFVETSVRKGRMVTGE